MSVPQPIQRPNQRWRIDVSVVDAFCAEGRPSIHICMNTHTGQFLSLISQAPKPEAVAALVKKAVAAWGVPEMIETDDCSNLIAGEAELLMRSLGIQHEASHPYSPLRKGRLERLMRTLSTGLQID